MKYAVNTLLLLPLCWTTIVHAQISNFQHIIIVIQENRTPDNLFQGLCSAPFGKSTSCSTKPTGSQYDILTSNWLDKTSSTGVTQPAAIALNNSYDVSHSHDGFTTTCDIDSAGVCRMDGAALTTCTGTCVSNPNPHYKYVSNTSSILTPYLTLATSYGWANYMFQTNQGPTFPAHQFLFGGTSAPSAADDAAGTFADSNVFPAGNNPIAGCIAPSTIHVNLIEANGKTTETYPCFEHQTLSDLLESGSITWKYYTPGAGSIVTAPNAIDHICVPNQPSGGECTGADWKNVVVKPSQVLTDIGNCKLAGVTWVTPSGKNSDHANSNTGGGPAWVASIVNAVGNNKKCNNGEIYWNNTAILITWDDWGGWYDHEPPTILAGAEGDFQYGFRVPFLFVSAYTQAASISNDRLDFGSILRFVEHNFGIAEGALAFADARSNNDLSKFFNLKTAPRPFTTIPAALGASYFINDKSPLTDPDDY